MQLFCLVFQFIGSWSAAGEYPGHSDVRSVLFFLTASMHMHQVNIIAKLQILSLNIALGGVKFYMENFVGLGYSNCHRISSNEIDSTSSHNGFWNLFALKNLLRLMR